MQKYLWKYFLFGHTHLQQLSIVTKSWLWPSNYWLSCKARTILFWFGFICKWTERLFCFKWHFKGSSINDVRHTLYPLPLMAYSSYLVTILMTPFPKILTSLKYDPPYQAQEWTSRLGIVEGIFWTIRWNLWSVRSTKSDSSNRLLEDTATENPSLIQKIECIRYRKICLLI